MARNENTLTKGSTLGPYKIVRLIGEGGMGEVYEARDEVLNRHVALKVISPKIAGANEIIQRFMLEGQALARMNHQNVVLVYALGEEKGTHYIVMEYVDGHSLYELVRSKKKLEVDEALHYFKQLLEGVKALHENGIIHRDIKPKNIIVRKDNSVKIVDFGIAKIEGSSQPDLTSVGELVGSIYYLAPEVIDGGPPTVQSDIWSLGVNLYEMLIGENPFKGTRFLAVVDQITKEGLKFSVGNKIPEGLRRIMLKMCEQSPERRYSSVTEIIKDIQAFKKNDPLGVSIPEMTPIAIPSLDFPQVQTRSGSFSSSPKSSMPTGFHTAKTVQSFQHSTMIWVLSGLLLVAGATYWVRNRGNSSNESVVTESNLPPPPVAAATVKAEIKSLDSPPNGQKIWLAEKEAIRFEWSGSTGDDTYLEISKDRQFRDFVVEEAHPASPYIAKNISDEGVYYWRLTQRSAGLSRALIEPANFTVLTKVAPALLYPVSQISYPTSQPVKFYWQEKRGASQYRFQMALDAAFTRLFNDQLISDTQTPALTPPAGDYYWRVRAEENPAMTSQWSEIRTVRVQKMLANSVPEKAPVKAAERAVERVSSRKEKALESRSRTSVASSSKTRGLVDVKANEPAKVSLATPSVSKTSQKVVMHFREGSRQRGPTSTPEALLNPPTLMWNKVKNASSYEVQISKRSDFAQIDWSKHVSETHTRWDSAQPGKYFWRVRAVKGAAGRSNFSSAAVLELQLPPSKAKSTRVGKAEAPSESRQPAAVTEVSETVTVPVPEKKAAASIAAPDLKLPPNGVSIVSLSSNQDPISFRWENVEAATSYRLELSESEKFNTVLHSQSIQDNQLILTKSLPKGRIYWRVRAEKGSVKSDWSPIFSFEVSR